MLAGIGMVTLPLSIWVPFLSVVPKTKTIVVMPEGAVGESDAPARPFGAEMDGSDAVGCAALRML